VSRRTVVAVMVGAVLTGGLAAPAAAGPLGDSESLCLRLDDRDEERKGICVWLPDPRPGADDRNAG
jgi:hypothetical protein